MSSFRLFLQAELARRCAANKQYSLRAFAASLGLSHSTLSQLIRGRRQLTARTIQRLGSQLGLDRGAIDDFVAHEQLAAVHPESVQEIRQLTLDTIGVLSDPTHRAILELTHLPQFVADSRWISRFLNVPIDDVNRCLARLIHLGLLEMISADQWQDHADVATTPPTDFARLTVRRLADRVRRLVTPVVHGETLLIPKDRWNEATRLLNRLRALTDPTTPGHEVELRFRVQVDDQSTNH